MRGEKGVGERESVEVNVVKAWSIILQNWTDKLVSVAASGQQL